MARIAVVETKVFKFEELSEKAKERALQEHSANGMYHDWWDYVYEDAKTLFALCGIAIDNIYFSGFWSQGDGACFEGLWYARDTKPANEMKDRAPLDEKLHRIAAGFADFAARFPTAAFIVKQSGHYFHKYSTSFEVEFPDDILEALAYDSPAYKERSALVAEAEKEVIALARDAMQWIYDALEKDHDHQTSEESFKQLAEANEWEFTEAGDIF